ncbi:CoA transferase [Myxococcota bacterium]|nr:CoA transferase [Myxococcota bacterium]
MRIALGEEPHGPLAGVRVIDLSTIVSGPLCTQILGDLGADVIKIETPLGDSVRYIGGVRKGDLTGAFTQVNRNKRSVVLDLKQPSNAEALARLVATADVLLENFRPGVMERLGVGYERLRHDNPRLIYAAISGFGPTGPYANKPAYDMVIQAISGVAKILGSPEEPRLVSNLLADKTAGLHAVYAITAALFERERSGKGQRVEIPMLDAFTSFLHLDTMGASAFGADNQVGGFGDLLFRAWKTVDGHVVALVVEDHQFAALCEIVERPDLAVDSRFAGVIGRVENAWPLIELLDVEISKFTTAELLERAERVSAPLASVNDLEGFLADPQVQSSRIVFELDHQGVGPVPIMRSVPRYSRTPSDVRRSSPHLGEHTHEVLREAGLSEADIAALSQDDES